MLENDLRLFTAGRTCVTFSSAEEAVSVRVLWACSQEQQTGFTKGIHLSFLMTRHTLLLDIRWGIYEK